MSESTYTEEELSAFSDKLQAWGESLDGREQQLLGNLVGLAAAHTQAEAEGEEPEVAGFRFARSSSQSFGALSFDALPRPRLGSVWDSEQIAE